jgi:glucuronosyltransferase
VAAKSHWNVMKGVLHALVGRGHAVKVYTPFPADHGTPPTDNYTEVETSAHYHISSDTDETATAAVNMNASAVVPLGSDCVSHAARRLGVPLVYVVPAPLLPWIETAAFGHYSNPAVAPHLFAAYAVPDTFYRRLHSAAMHPHTRRSPNYWYTALPNRPDPCRRTAWTSAAYI